MEVLYNEVHEYLQLKDDVELGSLTVLDLREYVQNYGDFLTTLIPDSVPKHMHTYINTAQMVCDMYQNEEIEIFRFDPNDDTNSIGSCAEYSEPDYIYGFINGVKLLDEYDIREQITANKYTGGFWDTQIHWVLNVKKLTHAILAMNN